MKNILGNNIASERVKIFSIIKSIVPDQNKLFICGSRIMCYEYIKNYKIEFTYEIRNKTY